MNTPQELKNTLRKNDIHPVIYDENFFVIEVACHNCDGHGLVEHANGKEYECTRCYGSGRREVTIQEKQIDSVNFGFDLPIEIKVNPALRELVKLAGGWVFCGEIYLPTGKDNNHGQIEYTWNELNQFVESLPF